MKILELNILKQSSGAYEVCELHSGHVIGSTVHESIAAALIYFGTDIPPGSEKYVNVEYAGVRLATTPLSCLAQDAERLASDLIQVAAEIHHTN